jgi:hypothetical protein
MKIVVLFLIIAGLLSGGCAEEVRVDLLTESSRQEEFGAVLATNGVSETANRALLRAIKGCDEEPLVLDLKKFPEARDGRYVFTSMESLTRALPPKLWETEHSWCFNCFDAVILTAGEKINFQLDTDALSGPFFAVVTETNQVSVRPCATAKDAFSVTYHQWYRDATAEIFAESGIERRRVGLTTLLFSSYVLPLDTEESDLADVALRVLRARWDRYQVAFKDVEVVLAHEVNFAGRYFITSHAGLLMKEADGFVYFEKCGGAGPFVRLDSTKREDLQTWFENMYRSSEPRVYSHHLVSFNDQEMRLLRK